MSSRMADTGCQWSRSSRTGSSSACRAGDLDAFEEFFNTYKRPVYITALAITRDPFLAEEILQDCFVKAYRVRQRLRTDRSPLPWLQRVTTNLCYSRIAPPPGAAGADHQPDHEPRRRPRPRARTRSPSRARSSRSSSAGSTRCRRSSRPR